MKILTCIIIVLIAASGVLADGNFRHAIGVDYGLTNISQAKELRYPFESSLGIRMSTYMIGKWRLELGFTYDKIYGDSTAGSNFAFGSDTINRVSVWKSYNLNLLTKYRLMPLHSKFAIDLGIGAGIANWKFADAHNDTLYNAPNERDESIDLAATEVFISASLGLEYRILDKVKIDSDIQANFLTGFGQEFKPSVETNLPNMFSRVSISLSYLFGSEKKQRPHADIGSPSLSNMYIESVKGDFTGRNRAAAYNKGPDNDNDGIPDINDLCPETPPKARGLIDIHGCAIDADSDGYPDYLDKCPQNRTGATVDASGCPLDSDGDGVPNGIDNCPDSDPSMTVDPDGCVNVEDLKKPLVMHIQYESGSFEIDLKHKKILEDLSRLLLKAGVIKVEIYGYTDNIGVNEANRVLSQKRANRVKDYLVKLGIDQSRITAVGKGEQNFIESNETREGRSKNRRVEMVFYK